MFTPLSLRNLFRIPQREGSGGNSKCLYQWERKQRVCAEYSRTDKKIYDCLKYSEEWALNEVRKNTTRKRHEHRFKIIVDQFGEWQIYSHLLSLVKEKIAYLAETQKRAISLPIYSMKKDHFRFCKSCNKPLNPNQKKESLYCSAKYVGYEAAHKCRNSSSNSLHNLKRKIVTINRRGVLFDIKPYLSTRAKLEA